MAVMSLLSKSSEHAACALADRIVATACEDAETRHPGRDIIPVERNARRRVYDALKVMVAVGSVQRDIKQLRWIGVDHIRHLDPSPTHSLSVSAPPLRRHAAADGERDDRLHREHSFAQLRVSLCKTRTRVGRKKAMLQELQRRIDAFGLVHERRRQADVTPPLVGQKRKRVSVAPGRRFYFPLMMLCAREPIMTYSRDRRAVRIDMPAAFSLFTETDVVCRLAQRYKPVMKRGRKPRAALPSAERGPALCVARRDTVAAEDPATPGGTPPKAKRKAYTRKVVLHAAIAEPKKEARRDGGEGMHSPPRKAAKTSNKKVVQRPVEKSAVKNEPVACNELKTPSLGPAAHAADKKADKKVKAKCQQDKKCVGKGSQETRKKDGVRKVEPKNEKALLETPIKEGGEALSKKDKEDTGDTDPLNGARETEAEYMDEEVDEDDMDMPDAITTLNLICNGEEDVELDLPPLGDQENNDDHSLEGCDGVEADDAMLEWVSLSPDDTTFDRLKPGLSKSPT